MERYGGGEGMSHQHRSVNGRRMEMLPWGQSQPGGPISAKGADMDFSS